MLKYELEKFPQSMRQGPKVVIPLRPPSSRHWNIESDLIFTIAVDTHQRRHEAKRTGEDQERESAGAEESPRETPAPEGASRPLPVAARLRHQWRPHARGRRI